MIIDFSDPHRCLAIDIEARRTGPEAEPRLATGEKFAKIHVLIEFDAY
jgi:hypothetical protein